METIDMDSTSVRNIPTISTNIETCIFTVFSLNFESLMLNNKFVL